MPDRGWELPGGYRIDPFAEQDAVSPEDLIALWTREAVLPPEEAERRVGEVLLVATDPDRRPVGIATTYLQLNEQLRAQLWYYRAFVSPSHRAADIARLLALLGRDHLSRRYVDGLDRRGIGLIYEVENEGLKRYAHHARWPELHFTFIGENAAGAHVYVHYFLGALPPAPPGHGSA
jgi:hypothetical protein